MAAKRAPRKTDDSPVLRWQRLAKCDPVLGHALKAMTANLAAVVVEEAVSIADKATPEDVGVARLRVDTRMKIAAGLDGRWGGKLDVTSAGKELPPAVIVLPTLDDEVQA